MIDGVQVMMLTQQLDALRKEVHRGADHSTTNVPEFLTLLAHSATKLAAEIRAAKKEG